MRPGPNSAERTDIHDPSAACRKHQFRRSLAAEKDRFQVYVMNVVPLRFGDFEWVDAGEPRRIIHEPVQVIDFREHAANFVNAGQIRTKQTSTAAGFRRRASVVL
jgi:hypothetical protein